ncbi:hypothetical protein FACS1894182_14890 [Bacteroidia bacterium]|nr:hypothetical protein FACS1894182_14890 [Bacteroidia bacterium]
MLYFKKIENAAAADWLVFIHGLGGSSAIFYKQIPYFSSQFNLLLIDLKGHGRSSAPEPFTQRYTYDQIARDVIEVLDFLQLEACHFIGCSLGTIVVRKIAETAPERVKSMGMAGAIVCFNLRSKFLMCMARKMQSFVPYMWVYSLYSKVLMPRKRHERSRSLFINNALKMGQKEFFRWFALTAQISSFLRLLYSVESSIPTLYLMGEDDYMFLPQVKTLLAKFHRQHSSLVVVPDSGHAFPGFQIDGNYYAIEATGINGAGLGGVYSAEQAFKRGMEELQETFQAVRQGKEGYQVLDVNELYRMGIIPMELRDDNFARQKIDEYASLWDGSSGRSISRNTGNATVSSGNSSKGSSGPAAMATFSRGVVFSYPAHWQIINHPNSYMPLMTCAVISPQGYIEVYQVDGANNVWEGLNRLVQRYGSLGMVIRYQQNGSHNGYSLVSGVSTNAAGQQAAWTGAFRVKGNAVVGVVIPAGVYQAQQILNSLR